MNEEQKATEATEPSEPVESVLTDGVEELVQHMDIPQPLEPYVAFIGDHPWAKGLLILLVFIVIAKLVEWLLIPLIRRLTSRTSTDKDDLVLHYIHAPLFWTVTLIGALAAAAAAGIGTAYRPIMVSAVVSVLIFLWMLFTVRISKLLLSAASARAKPSSVVRPQTLPLFTNLAAIFIFIVAIYFLFQAWHVDMTAWLASAGIAGIAIGFAAKDTLANLFSGVFIMADSPYKIGDYVVLDDGGGLRGKITHIGIRSTRLLTRDDVEVTIPNAIMGNTKVVNESGGPHVKYRIRVAVGVAYGSDIDQVRKVLQSVAKESDAVCTYPEPRVRFRTFGASSLDFELLCWVDDPELRGRVMDALNSAVYKKFLAEGIEIPYAKQDLYIKELPNGEI